VNIVSRGIRLYQGDFRREVHNWPSKQHSYLGFCSANGNTDGPRINIPVYAAVFNYYRAVYYTNTETFETTPADLDDYKNHHDLYGYIEMMIIVI
jgi:hypothetical protein